MLNLLLVQCRLAESGKGAPPALATPAVLFTETMAATPSSKTPTGGPAALTSTATLGAQLRATEFVATRVSLSPAPAASPLLAASVPSHRETPSPVPSGPSTLTPASPVSSPMPTRTSVPPATLASAGVPASTLPALEREMVEAVNGERRAVGLLPYRVDQRLAGAARAHARDMATRDYLSHVTPEGKTLEERLQEWDLQPSSMGENIVSSPGPADEAVLTGIKLLMDDAPHRAIILHQDYTRIGVGVAEGQPGWYIFVLDLASE